MMATIPVKLNKSEVSKIDHLVEMGKYRSRNQAIRSFIKISLLQESIYLEERNPEIEELKRELYIKWDSQSEFSLKIKGKISLVDMVSQDRMR